MTDWSDGFVREVLAQTAGTGGPSYRRIWTDSRTAAAGDLFVALSGERFDGHTFLESVREAGVRGAVVRRGTPPVVGLTLYEVDDPLRSLGWLARARRRQITGPVVAVTGTNGKTSTKELLAAALATRYRVHATRLNLNNLVGVPTTILEAPDDTEAMVVEAGANLPGEIARYREIIEPDLTVITNVAPGHLEGFGSLDGILREKLTLAGGVPVAVVGTEPSRLAAEARAIATRVVTAGLADAEIQPSSVSLGADGRARLVVDGVALTVGPIGLHQAANAMLVWAVARELVLDPSAVAAAIEQVRLPGGRGQLLEQGGLVILNDSYNANPGSFRAAMELARSLAGGRRLIFVAGSMLELGAESGALHAEIARALVDLDADVLVGVGLFADALAPYRASLGDRLILAADAVAGAAALAPGLSAGALVVLKGSRGVALERMLPHLTVGSST
jgi:UDP-N-acetylmuramoyl-tripeptide--D-alanyl-D-alanine ligase